uniref:Ig-like domain-containing protein n=1 Tax=Steinernema glaseri TaxID=37863 RepID=A0A1I7ZXH5_9BILA
MVLQVSVPIVGGTLLDSLIAPVRTSDTDGVYREEQVQIFMRQLLAALQYMHNKKIAHLDLRPEACLLQDDHIRLADFGQSRRLMAGRIHGEIQGSPEFVSPEIASCKENVTLATDMWSTGVLTYVLLSGISPFLGDSDAETLANVQRGQYSLDVPEFDDISDNAKDFINRLLQKQPHTFMLTKEAERRLTDGSNDSLPDTRFTSVWNQTLLMGLGTLFCPLFPFLVTQNIEPHVRRGSSRAPMDARATAEGSKARVGLSPRVQIPPQVAGAPRLRPTNALRTTHPAARGAAHVGGQLGSRLVSAASSSLRLLTNQGRPDQPDGQHARGLR